MKQKFAPAAAAREIAEARTEICRLNAILRASERGLWSACAQSACRRRRMCLGGEASCAPKPPRPRKPISSAELRRRLRGSALALAQQLARSITAPL